jgi:PAS domain S-box-containing protein
MDPMINILHIEDNPTDTQVILTRLKQAGLICRVTRIQTCTELKTALQQDTPDVILTDYKLSMYDGISALRLVQELHSEIPFIFVSGTKGEEAVIDALTKGATNYVLKHNLSRLESVIQRALREAQNRRKNKTALKTLAVSEAMMNSIMENIGVGVALISPRMEILKLNKKMRKWFPGIDPSQHPICYKAFNTPPRHEVCAYCPTCKTLKDGRGYEAITETVKDDSIRYYRIISSPLTTADGEIVAAMEMVEDITERKQVQEALQHSKDLFRAVIEAAPVAIIGLDLSGCVHSVWNSAAEKMLGWGAKEVMGRPLPSVPADRQEEFRHFRELIRSGKTINGALVRRQRRDSTPIYYSIYASPLYDDEGCISGNIAVLVDMTEKKQAEEEMLRSDQRLRLHRELSPLGFLEWDENFRAIEWNAACERIFGYTRKEAIGRHAKDLILPDDIHETVDGIYQSLMSQTGGQHSINKNVTKDGRTIVCEWFNTTLVDKDGNAVGVASVCNDITAQKQAEESIRKLSQAIEQSPVSIIITDTKGSIEFVNAKFTQITGYTYAEVQGLNPRILKSGETPTEEYRELWRTISSGGVWRGEFHNRKKNGELFWENATIAPVKNGYGVITNFLAVKEDITGQKRLEEQLQQTQKMEAVGQLAGGVAHDFNNMLGVIIGYAEMALEKIANDDALREDLEQIKIAGHYSAEITRQLLAFARKQAIMPKILNLNKIVESMLKLLKRLIGEDINLAWHPEDNLWAVKIDPSQIDQVLANLCINAKDAITGVGKVTIETQNVNFDEVYCAEHKGFFPGEYVMLAVSDNGSGMDKQTLGKIFEPFFTTKGMGRGTGLGLATVYGVVKQNAGFIIVYSEPGDGTIFKIYLPRHTAEAEQLSRETRFTAVMHGSETILLVEDDTFFLGMVRKVLEQFGYKVFATSTPMKAVTVATENLGKIDLLLTDVIMPEMTGRELGKKLCVPCPKIKCLFMSGYMGNTVTHHGVMGESVNFIQKPFSAKELGIKVREILDRE